MPTIEELLKETYYHYSKRAADIGRQLALVGIATAWIFRMQQKDGSVAVPSQLVTAILLLATGVALDFIRYLWQTGFWGVYCWWKEKQGISEIHGHPEWVNWPPLVLMWIGFAAVLAGFGFLAVYLVSSIKTC